MCADVRTVRVTGAETSARSTETPNRIFSRKTNTAGIFSDHIAHRLESLSPSVFLISGIEWSCQKCKGTHMALVHTKCSPSIAMLKTYQW